MLNAVSAVWQPGHGGGGRQLGVQRPAAAPGRLWCRPWGRARHWLHPLRGGQLLLAPGRRRRPCWATAGCVPPAGVLEGQVWGHISRTLLLPLCLQAPALGGLLGLPLRQLVPQGRSVLLLLPLLAWTKQQGVSSPSAGLEQDPCSPKLTCCQHPGSHVVPAEDVADLEGSHQHPGVMVIRPGPEAPAACSKAGDGSWRAALLCSEQG